MASGGAAAGAAAAGACYAAAQAAAKAAKRAIRVAGVVDDYQLVYAPPNKLTICEAFCLLWQDDATGDLSGRRSDPTVQGPALAAMLTDLILMGKLKVQSEDGKDWLGYTKENARIITGDVETPLPAAAAFLADFLKIFTDYNAQKPPRTLEKWVQELVMGWSHNAVAYIDFVLNSLLEKGIVRKESVWNGKRFPTDDPTAEAAVREKLKTVLLSGTEPDMFTTVLIQLSVTADQQCVFTNPFMRSVLSKEEYAQVQPRLKELKENLDMPLNIEAE
ncbi:hypothetical protein CYMTET_41504 [Cymbomonas tetramitiformis]|uniref:Uncharacterized protein n=1 Tax=Cymbomonas tetramitiformis TaxID=36881 RepID=A0AAE0C5Y8_9CHLO|nr:hypothetical protein CYMTET_41504 [Cymbomonas tetramitiformis]|eukprot:gene28224-34955_t